MEPRLFAIATAICWCWLIATPDAMRFLISSSISPITTLLRFPTLPINVASCSWSSTRLMSLRIETNMPVSTTINPFHGIATSA